MRTQKILLQFEPKPENLLPALKAVQKENQWIEKSACEKIATYFSLPLSEVYSTASFYDLLKTKKVTKKNIKVCSGGPCLDGKSAEIVRQIEMMLGTETGKDSHPKYKLETMSCVGLCDRGPVVEVDGQVFEKVRPETVDDILRDYL